MKPETNSSHSPSRRKFIFAGAIAFLSALFGRKVEADPKPEPLVTSGQPLTTDVRLGNPPLQPLDTMILFERGDDNNGRPMTHEILSLIHQELGKNSYPWTIYASLETHHEVGDACVLCSRLNKYGPGWSTGLHSEVFNHARAVAIGVNVEMSSDYTGSEAQKVIGMNIQAVHGPTPMQYGIHIHDGENHFETGIGLEGKGAVGLDLPGQFQTGIHTHSNNIRLNEGSCIELEETGRIRVRYRKGRVEFLNGDRCFGHLDVNGEDHPL